MENLNTKEEAKWLEDNKTNLILCGAGILALFMFGNMAYNKGLAAGRAEITDVIVGLAKSGAMR